MRTFTLRQLLLLVPLVAIAAVVIEKRYLSVRRMTEKTLRTTPTSTELELFSYPPMTNEDGSTRLRHDLVSDGIVYTLGGYGVLEFANTRIAVRGYGDGGQGNHRLVLASTADSTLWGSGGGSGGTGDHYLTAEGITGGTRCRFGKLPFVIQNGRLQILDRTFDAIRGSQLILVGGDLQIESVHELPAHRPPPDLPESLLPAMPHQAPPHQAPPDQAGAADAPSP